MTAKGKSYFVVCIQKYWKIFFSDLTGFYFHGMVRGILYTREDYTESTDLIVKHVIQEATSLFRWLGRSDTWGSSRHRTSSILERGGVFKYSPINNHQQLFNMYTAKKITAVKYGTGCVQWATEQKWIKSIILLIYVFK